MRAPLAVRDAGDGFPTEAALEAWRTAFRVDFETDAVIWENKQYLPRPRLTGADGPIMQLRDWARRFYVE